ncbi:methyltransferase domain-containing protein [Streptomyces sp. NBC_01497]|uniref:methyltransferase domain-containing protein n=1 Tax=Streptomyces sp. NBC_01497 TaxID=2903885 RepID=UPI002E30EFAE|nr:methyltransferase domain-containing protein [Streptomyces sp. NBC_01497]
MTIDWDAEADTFDREPDHGLLPPEVRAAWAAKLAEWLPGRPCEVLDLGCGTGSLALLAAERGHHVTAVDLSPRMAERARAKLAGTDARVLVGDAVAPPVPDRAFDVVLVRHVLWALPEPEAALRHWVSLLRPGGRLVLVEGVWGDAGLPHERIVAALTPLVERVRHIPLAGEHALWGKRVDDDRYAVLGGAASAGRHTEIVDVHLILRRGDEVLLARRQGTGYADGLLHAPSGHVEDGEDVRAALLREAYEETGVRLGPEDVRVALVMQHRGPGGQPRIGWFFEAEYGAGARPDTEPYNREPDKCSGLSWHPLAALPDDMVAYCAAGLEAYRAGGHFVLHWHEDGDGIARMPGGASRAVTLPGTGAR